MMRHKHQNAKQLFASMIPWMILCLTISFLHGCTKEETKEHKRVNLSNFSQSDLWIHENTEDLAALVAGNVDEQDHYEWVSLYYGVSSQDSLFFYTVNETKGYAIDHLYAWEVASSKTKEIEIANIDELYQVIWFHDSPIYVMVKEKQDEYEWRILMDGKEWMTGSIQLLSQLPMMAIFGGDLLLLTTTPSDKGLMFQLYQWNGHDLTDRHEWNEQDYGPLHIKDILISEHRMALVMQKGSTTKYQITSLVMGSDGVVTTDAFVNQYLPYNVMILKNHSLFLVSEQAVDSPYLRNYDRCRLYRSEEGTTQIKATDWVGDCMTDLVVIDEHNAIGIKNNVLSVHYMDEKGSLLVEQVDLNSWLPKSTLPLQMAVIEDVLYLFPFGVLSQDFFVYSIPLFE